MNRQTNLFSFEDNLINCIQNCLSNIPSFSTLAKHLSIDEIKKNIKKEQLQSEEKQRIIKKNTFQMIVNSIISVLGNDRFKIEKAIFPQNCPFCQYGVHNSFDINYVAINLSNYLGEEFDLKEFIRPIKGEAKCRKCKKNIDSEIAFTLLPEILIVVLGAKSENKFFSYDYSSSFQYYDKNNNRTINCNYILKALIGQTEILKFKPFLFNNETSFNNYFEQNKDIFTNPTILFYEGPRKVNSEDNEYLEPDDLENEDNDVNDNNNLITIYFIFTENGKKIYLDYDPNEKFSKAVEELKEKYIWLKSFKNMKFYLGDKILDGNKTLAENGIQDNSEINIK